MKLKNLRERGRVGFLSSKTVFFVGGEKAAFLYTKAGLEGNQSNPTLIPKCCPVSWTWLTFTYSLNINLC